MSRSDSFDLPEELLDAALLRLTDRPSAEREQELAELQAAHPSHAAALARLAVAMLEADHALASTFHRPAPDDEPQFDGYRVLQKLGEGAFGVVYLGEQHEPVRREVAIKVLRPGAGDRSTLARFDAERGFLARLRHPAIAQIYGSGLLPDGRPWFVMEYVPGVPFARYCDERRLAVDARVQLFVRLCQGVQHAHEHGIVHRDLKPANVLVVEVDGEAQPKIIDFGIARALERTDGNSAIATETGRVVGTPGYMSPEQMAGEVDAIDARSDVWSLGVMLYELLTGQLPWGRRPTQTDSDPPRPSSRIGTTSQESTTTAEQRSSHPRRLVARLRGDLDWIVLEALAREREQRYATARDLADDVQRHLRGEPVLAGPPSFAYRLRKFVVRHRIALSALAVVTVLGIGSAIVLSGYRNRLLAHEQMASTAADRLLERANDRALLDRPGAEELRQALADDALRCAEDLLREQPDDPRRRTRRSQTLRTLSQVGLRLGRSEEAERLSRAAAADAEAVLAEAPTDGEAKKALAWAVRNIGQALSQRSLRAEARPHLQRAIDLFEQCRREGAGGEGGLVRALSDLCAVTDPGSEAAEVDALLQRAIEVQAGILHDHPEALFERDLFCSLGLQRCQLLLQTEQMPAAREVLQSVDEWIGQGEGLQPGTIVRAHETASLLAQFAGDRTAAADRLDRAIAAARAWRTTAERWAEPYRSLYRLLSSRIGMQMEAGEDATADLRELIALGEQEIAMAPDDREGPLAIVIGAAALCERLLARGSLEDLADVEAWARLACQQVARLPERTSPQERRNHALTAHGNLGLIADALGLADADAIWEQTAHTMLAPERTPAEQGARQAYLAMLGLRVAAHRSAAGRDDDAAAMLQVVAPLVAGGDAQAARHRPALARQQALLAGRDGRYADAIAVLERLLATDRDWRAVDAAATGMFELWQTARAANDTADDDYRDRATAWCNRVIASLAAMPASDVDPWLRLPLAKARVRLGLLARASGEPLPLSLAAAIDTLQQLRGHVHAVEWDEALFRAGAALLQR